MAPPLGTHVRRGEFFDAGNRNRFAVIIKPSDGGKVETYLKTRPAAPAFWCPFRISTNPLIRQESVAGFDQHNPIRL